MANMQKKQTRTQIWLVTEHEYDADHTPKRERKKNRPDDEEVRSLVETLRDALAEQGIELVGWTAQQGPYKLIRAQRTDAELERYVDAA